MQVVIMNNLQKTYFWGSLRMLQEIVSILIFPLQNNSKRDYRWCWKI